MLKVGIVGCGKIADQHAQQIGYISGCRIVGVCDREELMAKQLQERLGIPAAFQDVEDLIGAARPDVVHITSPPQSHYSVAMRCLEAGCHVYIEKPFTVVADEAERLIRFARERALKVTTGHNTQFSHAANRMRSLVASGYLGGPPVHMESYYCYNLSDAAYAKALLGDSGHWVRTLPGGLLQNTISHGISKIAEFMTGDDVEVVAYGYTSPLLRNIGESGIVDELRVILHDGSATGYFTFSSQMRPSLHLLRLYGSKNGLVMDENQQTVIRIPGTPRKSYLEQFLPQWDIAKQYAANSLGNIRKFMKADFQSGYGMRVLTEQFYRSITEDAPLPIPYGEIIRTARIMDAIFEQLNSKQSNRAAGIEPLEPQYSGRER
jgi:predicted dehydrogenase